MKRPAGWPRIVRWSRIVSIGGAPTLPTVTSLTRISYRIWDVYEVAQDSGKVYQTQRDRAGWRPTGMSQLHFRRFTRRGVLFLAAGASASSLFAASDFWNKKD